MIKFEVGKTYSTRSICDHNCIYSIEVLKRTAKTITVREHAEVKTLRISIYKDVEQVKPHGSYSMAAIIDATDTKKLLKDWEKAQSVDLPELNTFFKM